MKAILIRYKGKETKKSVKKYLETKNTSVYAHAIEDALLNAKGSIRVELKKA